MTYHGPNHCSDKKPWAVYSHYHVTVVADRRLGCDTLYNSMVALHRKKATCHIPASQTKRFPASWANYLAQRPRIPWYSCTNDLIGEFTSWTMEEHIDRNVPLPANRKRLLPGVANSGTQLLDERGSDRRRSFTRYNRKLLAGSHSPPFLYTSRKGIHNGQSHRN